MNRTETMTEWLQVIDQEIKELDDTRKEHLTAAAKDTQALKALRKERTKIGGTLGMKRDRVAKGDGITKTGRKAKAKGEAALGE